MDGVRGGGRAVMPTGRCQEEKLGLSAMNAGGELTSWGRLIRNSPNLIRLLLVVLPRRTPREKCFQEGYVRSLSFRPMVRAGGLYMHHLRHLLRTRVAQAAVDLGPGSWDCNPSSAARGGTARCIRRSHRSQSFQWRGNRAPDVGRGRTRSDRPTLGASDTLLEHIQKTSDQYVWSRQAQAVDGST